MTSGISGNNGYSTIPTALQVKKQTSKGDYVLNNGITISAGSIWNVAKDDKGVPTLAFQGPTKIKGTPGADKGFNIKADNSEINLGSGGDDVKITGSGNKIIEQKLGDDNSSNKIKLEGDNNTLFAPRNTSVESDGDHNSIKAPNIKSDGDFNFLQGSKNGGSYGNISSDGNRNVVDIFGSGDTKVNIKGDTNLVSTSNGEGKKITITSSNDSNSVINPYGHTVSADIKNVAGQGDMTVYDASGNAKNPEKATLASLTTSDNPFNVTKNDSKAVNVYSQDLQNLEKQASAQKSDTTL